MYLSNSSPGACTALFLVGCTSEGRRGGGGEGGRGAKQLVNAYQKKFIAIFVQKVAVVVSALPVLIWVCIKRKLNQCILLSKQIA